MNVTVQQYSDYYAEWWGLEDGTLLELNDERGAYWQKLDGKTWEINPPWQS